MNVAFIAYFHLINKMLIYGYNQNDHKNYIREIENYRTE